ncbi:putative dnaJ molecular chaperone homology domain [Lyophyllum shimeji]|uniref:DnaJ molecular chaperone homology domain n=1 Tax=Lyophyllum shimeji TaxID=47721 RepID=A0A9P3PSD7_LYOSH|nr:putative dnaJ molecular chaperone homology domain [Lyophyllum shimeji]
MNTEVEVNPYELLGIKVESTEQEIRTAYRQRSLKVHPDRNPNNPDAARKFHELNQAYEALLDPLRRLALDAKLRLKQARAERFKAYDNKRKNMVEELEAREREFKKQRVAKQEEERKRWQETEGIKEEGRRLREERERELRQREEEKRKAAEEGREAELDAPALDPLDTTVRLKYNLKAHPELTTRDSVAKLMATFGPVDIDSVVLSLKPPKKDATKPAKFGTALVPFKRIGDAFAAVCASGRLERGLEGIEVGWVAGKEPPILIWLKKMGKLGASPPPASKQADVEAKVEKGGSPQSEATPDTSSFSSFPSSFPDLTMPPKVADIPSAGIDYESLTLMRLRQAERERLEREILEQEAAEEQASA